MAKIKLLAGDFGTSSATFHFGQLGMPRQGGGFLPESVPVTSLKSVDIATEESVKRVGGTVGWGVAGAALLGPVGLLAGLLVGGRGKDVTFVAEFHNGKRFMGTTDAGTYKKLAAATF